MKTNLFFLLCLLVIKLDAQNYYENQLFVKLKHKESLNQSSFLKIQEQFQIIKIEPAFKTSILGEVYLIQFKPTSKLNAKQLVNDLEKLDFVIYAEKVPIYKLFFTPNDPQYSSQWNLAKIQADLAWNLSQGCSGIKVAITDDGFLMNHEDLINQWYLNTLEIAGNGIDDDNNGYIDDWRGWDAANNDNDPSAFNPTNSNFTHGTHVAGIAGAQTNNSLGIASIGFNNKLIPVKIGSSPSGSLTGALGGLDYAINASGCDVINMSWGGAGFSMTYQNLFNLAYSKGIICVAAAGNSSSSSPMYPASYNHVVSVASSASNDAKSGFSNYGSTIDVTAPGSAILSSLAGGISNYGNLSGTSMASPLVAGLCGLMRCYNPMPIDSIIACLKRTCDNIDAQNTGFIGQLGSGRINAFKALQCLSLKPKSYFTNDSIQCTGKAVRYFATSFGAPTLIYNWSFPGGTPPTSSLKNPVVTYATNGWKSATLITNNSFGSDTLVKTNSINIDTPEASLIGRRYTSYNSNAVIITVKFKGNPPFSVTLSDGTTNWTQTNIRSNPYFFSIVPAKDTSLITISAFSDSMCVGNKLGKDTIYRITIGGGGTNDCDTTNLITNGNLEAGNTGFTSEYNYSPSSNTSGLQYTVGNSNSPWNPWVTNICSDHTTGTGKMLIANGDSTPNKKIWSTTVATVINKNYKFTYWITSWSPSPASIRLKINNIDLNPIAIAPTSLCTWIKFEYIWNSGNNTSAILSLIDTSLVWLGNDFALDDLSFRLQCSQDCDTTNLNTGKVLHLDFNGNTLDKSGLGNHATNYGATSVAGKAGVANTAYSFNGTSSYMQIGNHASLTPTNNKLTLCAIIKPKGFYTGTCFGNAIINKGNTDFQNGNYLLRYTPIDVANTSCTGLDVNKNNFYSGVNNGGCSYSQIDNLPKVQSNTWTCVVGTYDGDTIRTYVNGILRHKCSYTGGIGSNAQDLFIGKMNNASFPYWLNADVDDIRIYNRVLAPSEVKGYCGTCIITSQDCDTTNLNTGKVLHLDFNGNTLDKSGLGNHATNFGATATAGKAGAANTAYRFNGTTNYMKVNHNSSLNPIGNKITLCANLKVNGYYNGTCWSNIILQKGDYEWSGGTYRMNFNPTPNSCSGFADTNNSNFTNWFGGGSCSETLIDNNPKIQKNQWYCVVSTYDGDSIKMYVNGILRFSCLQNSGLPSNTHDLFIGKMNWSGFPYWLNAEVDDIRVYNRVLAPSEVKGYCGTCSIPSQKKCDSARKYSLTKCTNESLTFNARLGSQYQWSPSTGLSNDTIKNPVVNSTISRTYLVSYTDTAGCQIVDTFDLKVKTPAFYTPLEDQRICMGDSAQASISIFGSSIVWTPNISISNPNIRNPYLFPNSSRNYFLSFIDTVGCLHLDTLFIKVDTCCAARARFRLSDSTICFGIPLSITNYSSGPIVSYSWTFGSAIPSSHSTATPPIIQFPSGGNYPIRLVVTNGICFDTLVRNCHVNQFKPFAGKDSINTCLANFSYQLGEDPILDWTYKWSPSSFLTDPNISNPIANIVNDSINYILEAEDKIYGCKFYDTVIVSTSNNVLSQTSYDTICYRDSFKFRDSFYSKSGIYTRKIKYVSSNCDSFIYVQYLKVLSPDTINYVPEHHCEFYIDPKGKKHTSNFTYRDTFKYKYGCDSAFTALPIFIHFKTYKFKKDTACYGKPIRGKYYDSTKNAVDSFILKSVASGCDSIITIYNVHIYPQPKASITAKPVNPINLGDSVRLYAHGGKSYLWLHDFSTKDSIRYRVIDTNPVLFEVIVTDSNKCKDTAQYWVYGEYPNEFYYGIPNIFSPNGDPMNNIFIPNMNYVVNIKRFMIWNRWGEKMWETYENKGWNGQYKNQPAPPGVYIYYLELNTPKGIRIHKGDVTLVR